MAEKKKATEFNIEKYQDKMDELDVIKNEYTKVIQRHLYCRKKKYVQTYFFFQHIFFFGGNF